MTDSWSQRDTVLLVEDDESWIPVLERAFDEVGLPHYERVGNAEEAIAYLEGHHPYSDRNRFPMPTMILTSIRLPRMSGLEMVGWLKSRSDLRRIPVIIFTGSEDPHHVAKAYEAGANSYLVKPHGYRELTELLHAFRAFWMGSIRV